MNIKAATATPNKVLAPYTFFAGANKGIQEGTIPSKSAATITPGTTDQTIAAGQYLSGDQTIAGDADLIPANIGTGKNIFGVDGTGPSMPDTIAAGNTPIKAIMQVVPVTQGTYPNYANLSSDLGFVVATAGTYRIIYVLGDGLGGGEYGRVRLTKNGTEVAGSIIGGQAIAAICTLDLALVVGDVVRMQGWSTSPSTYPARVMLFAVCILATNMQSKLASLITAI